MVACACLLLLGLAGVPADAGNAHLVRARGEVERLQYDAARTSLERALKAGGSTPAETREILLLSAEVAATLGDRGGAEKHYRQLLALDAAAQLPPGASPKLHRPFAAARTAMRGKGAIQVRQEQSAGANPTVTLVVVADPLRMVTGARVRYQTSTGRTSAHAATGTGRVTLSLPRAARIEVMLSAVDRHGNRLVDIGPFVVEGPADAAASGGPDRLAPTGPPPPRTTMSLFPRWILWTAATTVALAASGITFGALADSTQGDIDRMTANSRQYTYSDLLAAKRRGDWQAMVSNISFGVAGAGAAVILTYYFVYLHSRTRATVLGLPTPSGAQLTLTLAF